MSGFRRVCLFAALAGVVGCESRVGPPSAGAVTRPPAARARAAPTPSAPLEAPAPAPAPLARTRVKRQLVSERACAAEVFAVQGRTFVACGREVLVLEAGQLRSEPALAAGLSLNPNPLGGRQIVHIAGRWPDALWAVTGEVSGNGNSHKLSFFRFRKDRWAKAGASVELGGPVGRAIFPWTDDGLAAVVARPFDATRFITFSAKPVATPGLAKAEQSRAEHEQYPCHSKLIYPETWARLGPGDVMVFSGQLCGVPGTGEDARSLGVERLRIGQTASEVTLLPIPDDAPASTLWVVTASAALSPAQVLVAADGTETEPPPNARARRFAHLARWDGANWHAERAPLKAIAGLWALGDRFAATDEQGALWLRREADWSAVEWVTDESSSDAWGRHAIAQLAVADGAFWLVRQEDTPSGGTSFLYRLELPSAP